MRRASRERVSEDIGYRLSKTTATASSATRRDEFQFNPEFNEAKDSISITLIHRAATTRAQRNKRVSPPQTPP